MVWVDDRVLGLNSSGRLPKAARLPEDGRVPERGIGSATVPGAPAGWLALAERFGTIPIAELVGLAARYAREGFGPSPSLRRGLEKSRWLLESDPEAERIFLTRDSIRNPELADVIEDLPNFYTGPVARSCPPPFDASDFAAHKAEWVEPLHTPFNGVEVYEMPPNSRGHLVLEAIKRMESLEGLRPDEPEFHFRMIRAIDSVSLSGDTVYLCAVDESGMAVSINESNYMGFGSGVVVPGTGVHLHNRGAYFKSSEYRGGERPIHTLSPAMGLKEGKPSLVFGTMGGEAQIQIHLQLLARILVAGEDPVTAVSAPRWVRHGSAELLVEEGLPEIGGVRTPTTDLAGHAHVIQRTREGWAAASDPRSDGLAAGY